MGMIQDYQLDQSLPLRLLRSVLDNVLLKLGGHEGGFMEGNFCMEQEKGVTLSHSYSLSFLVRGLIQD